MEHLEHYRIFVLSDGTGQTGKRVLEAALLQFDLPVMIIRIPRVRTVEQVKEVVSRCGALAWHGRLYAGIGGIAASPSYRHYGAGSHRR